MNTMLKTIVAAINLACLLVGLAYPNDVTALTILPPLVTSCAWLVITAKETQTTKLWHVVLLVAACIVGIACIFLGLTSKIQAGDPKSEYSIAIGSVVAWIGGKAFDYKYFAIVVIITFLALSASEIIVSYRTSRNKIRNTNLSGIKRC